MGTTQPKGFNTGLNSARYNQNSGVKSKLCTDKKCTVCYSLKCSCECHDVVCKPVVRKAKAA